jgi:hypothetical protein
MNKTEIPLSVGPLCSLQAFWREERGFMTPKVIDGIEYDSAVIEGLRGLAINLRNEALHKCEWDKVVTLSHIVIALGLYSDALQKE